AWLENARRKHEANEYGDLRLAGRRGWTPLHGAPEHGTRLHTDLSSSVNNEAASMWASTPVEVRSAAVRKARRGTEVTDDLFIAQLEGQLTHLRMGDKESATDYCNRARRILATIRMAGAQYSTASYITHVMQGLSSSYNLLKRLSMAPSTRATLNEDNLTSYILQDEAMQEAERSQELMAQANFVAPAKQGGRPGQRGQPGGGGSGGWKSTKEVEKKSTKDGGRGGGGRRRDCWICHSPDHLSFECPERSGSDDDDAKGGRGRSGQPSSSSRRKQAAQGEPVDDIDLGEGRRLRCTRARGETTRWRRACWVGVVEPTISLAPEPEDHLQAGCGSCAGEPGGGPARQRAVAPSSLQGEAGKEVLILNVLYVPGVCGPTCCRPELKEHGVKLQEDGDGMLLVSAAGARAGDVLRASPLHRPASLRDEVDAAHDGGGGSASDHEEVGVDAALTPGGEFLGKQFTDFVNGKGIVHDLTCPYTPQQNGMAEREMRTVVESVRTMLLHMGVQHHWWHLALRQAVWVRNCLERSTLPPGDDAQRSGKLKPKARWGLHLGVSAASKGWELLDVNTDRVVTTSDVVFYEEMSLAEWKTEHGPGSGRLSSAPPSDTSSATLPLLAEVGELATEDVEDCIAGGRRDERQVDVGLESTSTGEEQVEKQVKEQQPTREQAAVKPTMEQSVTGPSAGEPTTGEKSAGKPTAVEQSAGTPAAEQQDAEGSDDSDDGGDAEEAQSGPRRSGRLRRPPDFFVPAAFTTVYDVDDDDDLLYDDVEDDEEFPELDPDILADPEHRWDISTMTVKEALASWKGPAVKAAMEEEIRSLINMGTWELVERPPGVNVMKNRWVLTTKYHIDDTV
ncbi:unnamed protein product, partial [Closterium sp. NIES-64]